MDALLQIRKLIKVHRKHAESPREVGTSAVYRLESKSPDLTSTFPPVPPKYGVCVCVYAKIWHDIYVYIHMYIHTHVNIHTYIHIFTHTHFFMLM